MTSKDAQKRIAESLDESSKWADEHGYPEGAQNLRDQAARYREATGQTPPDQQQGAPQS